MLSLPAAFPGFVPAPPVAWVAAPAGAQCWMWLSFAFGDDARCPGFWRSRAGLPQMVASPQVVSPEGVFPGTARVVIVGGVYVSAHRTYSVGGSTRRQLRPRRLVLQINQGFSFRVRLP